VPSLVVYTWPYAVLFWVIFVWAFAPELRIVSSRQAPATSHDAHSKRLIVVGEALAIIAAFAIASHVPAATLAHRVPWFWAGVSAMVGGSVLRRHCWRMLGSSFTGSVIVRPAQVVVERGAYRYIRHPSYTAAIILFLGIGLALANWISLVVLAAVVSIVYGYRVAVEERALMTVVGEPYRHYMRRTKRFVPYLF
jgi:protein-S-isoprenylcysteine O-methyltransferase Ste14